jgi:formate hydrogenlyase subunit 4
VAAVYIWRSRDYKRLLAYSSVEHLGIITLSTGVGGAAMLGALLHALFNSFGKIALFFMAGRINRDLQTREINSVHGLSSISIFFLMITECSRMPVDDPNTHLELTMIHEVMILDASGFDLMLYQHAASLKLLLYAFLISILLNPFGWLNPLAGLALFVGVLAVLAACLAAIETLMARFRLVLVPQFLLYATVIGVLNILIFTFSH